jgi:hypothetical protein
MFLWQSSVVRPDLGRDKPDGYLLGSYRIATAPEPSSSRLTSFKSMGFDSPANNVGPWPASVGCTGDVLGRVTMQVFVRKNCTMIAAPVQCDVDGVAKRSHVKGSSCRWVANECRPGADPLCGRATSAATRVRQTTGTPRPTSPSSRAKAEYRPPARPAGTARSARQRFPPRHRGGTPAGPPRSRACGSGAAE